VGLDVPGDVIGQLQLDLWPVGERPAWREVKQQLTSRTAELAGILTEVRELAGGPRQGKDIRLQVVAQDRARL
jgi:hypothetical protein